MTLRNILLALFAVGAVALIALTVQHDSRACRTAGYDAVYYSTNNAAFTSCIKNDNDDIFVVPLDLLQN